MSEPATAELIADLLQRYYRNPMRYRAQTPRDALALGHLDVVLRLALGLPVEFSDPVLRKPATVAEIKHAADFYIRQKFFREGATHYDILGLAPDASADAVRENFRLVMQLIHPDRHGVDTPWPESFAARANRAYAVLKSPETRADYDRQQKAAHAKEAAARTAVMAVRLPARVVARRKQSLRMSVLPEWLTAGVGGFARTYPGITIFAVLIAVSVLMIAAVWPEHESVVIAETGYTAPQSARRGMPDGARIAPARSEARAITPDLLSNSAVSVPVPATAMPSVAVPTPRVSVPMSAAAPASPVPASPLPPMSAAASASPVPASPPAPMFAGFAPQQAAAALPARSPIQSAAAIQVVNPAGAIASGVAAAIPASTRVARSTPPGATEVEALVATFVSSYENGRLPMFADLFDDDAQTDLQRGRAAIRNEYDQLFRSTAWRRMSISQLRWQQVGDRTEGKGELTLKIGWVDGREEEQHVGVDMALVRHGGRTVIAKLSLQPR